jgi:hypothetical protein
MATFAYVPEIPGLVRQVVVTDTPWTDPETGAILPFPMHDGTGKQWFIAPFGTQEHYSFDGTNFLPPKDNSAAQAWHDYQVKAQAALNKSDVTMLRCVENSVSVPANWALYRKSLRAILSAPTGDPTQPLPVQPPYPQGT